MIYKERTQIKKIYYCKSSAYYLVDRNNWQNQICYNSIEFGK